MLQKYAVKMTFNEMRALNSLRCALNNSGENLWNFIASAYFLALALSPADFMLYLIDGYNYYYQFICTCSNYATKNSIAAGASELTASVFSACTEESQQLYVTNLIYGNANATMSEINTNNSATLSQE